MKTVIRYTAIGDARIAGKVVTTSLGFRGPSGPRGLQGLPGIPGSAETASAAVSRIASGVLSGHRAVRSLSALTVALCDAATPLHAQSFLGVTRGAADPGGAVSVQTDGELVEPSWSWSPGLPVFVGLGGVLTQTSPLTGFALVVGFAQSLTSLWVHPRPPVFL